MTVLVATPKLMSIGSKKIFLADSRAGDYLDFFAIANRAAIKLGFAGGAPVDSRTLHKFMMEDNRSGFFGSRNLLVAEYGDVKFRRWKDVVDKEIGLVLPWGNFKQMLHHFQIEVSEMPGRIFLIDPIPAGFEKTKMGNHIVVPNLASDSTKIIGPIPEKNGENDITDEDGRKGKFNEYGILVKVPQEILYELPDKEKGVLYSGGMRPVLRGGDFVHDFGCSNYARKVFASHTRYGIPLQVLVEPIEG